MMGGWDTFLPWLAILLALLHQPPAQARKKVNVYVAGFFPVHEGAPKHNLGRGVMPALTLAVSDVNAHPTVLRNYKLHVIWNDTQCDTGVGTKAFFDTMYKKPEKVMLFGAACTHVTDPIAKAAKHWHITQLSYADTHPMFSAIKYPNFFRMAPSEKEFNLPSLHLLQRFNWTRIGTVFQNTPRHVLAHNHLLSLLDSWDYEVAETQSFADELKGQIQKLKDKDVRIILGYFSEQWAKRIFCEAYRRGLYGENYQWIITGMYREEWWTLPGGDEREEGLEENPDDLPHESGGLGCAVEEIMTALEGCIMTDILPLASNNIKTVSGKNISTYATNYRILSNNEYSRFHGYTYDGVWAMALAIQTVGHKLHRINHHRRTNLTVENFRYRDEMWGNLFMRALSEVKFEGVTGPVQFTSDNTRKCFILLKQFQGGREVKIGEYDGFDNVLHLDKGHPIYWPGGNPPLDRTVKLIEKAHVNIRIYAVLVAIASLGIVMAAIFLAINIRYRNQRYIKMSSPHLNNLIIVGCILTYTSVILLGLDSGLTSETSFPYICTARAWVLMAGFSLAFGSMFSKTWRVHSIFTNVQLNKKVIKDYQLFIVVFVLLCVDVAIMTTWQIVDPFYRETKHLVPYMRGDILVIPENEYCKSKQISIFIGCIYAYKGLLMVFGCFLAWETRLVSIPALNDSKYIGMSVYNVVIMCVIGAPISYILSDEQDASYVIISVFIVFCTTGTLCLVFMPKIIELRRNPQGNIDKRIVRSTLKPPKRTDSDSDVSDLHDQIKKAEGDHKLYRKKLREKEQELQKMIEQLGQDALQMVEEDREDDDDEEEEEEDLHTSTAPHHPRRSSKPRSVERLRIEGMGPSVTETTEATELSSLCSAISHDGEYVNSPLQHSHHHHHYQQPPTPPPPEYSQLLHHQHFQLLHQPASLPCLPPLHALPRDQAGRRISFTSPEQTPRDSSKSVSFKLEGTQATVEAIPLLHLRGHHTQEVQQKPQLVQTQHLQQQQPGSTGTLEREGAAYGGYGGVYVHDYGGEMMQQEQRVLQQRRSSRPTVLDTRQSSRSDTWHPDPPSGEGPQWNRPSLGGGGGGGGSGGVGGGGGSGIGGVGGGYGVEPSIGGTSQGSQAPPPVDSLSGGPTYGSASSSARPERLLDPLGALPPYSREDTPPPVPFRKPSLKQACFDKYSQVPRNLYTPLNNEDNNDKIPLLCGKKNSDIKIINNTAQYQNPVEKNSNALANLGHYISGEQGQGGGGGGGVGGVVGGFPDEYLNIGRSVRYSQSQDLSIVPGLRMPVSRRLSEPFRPHAQLAMHLRNRSCGDLTCKCCDQHRQHLLKQQQRQAMHTCRQRELVTPGGCYSDSDMYNYLDESDGRDEEEETYYDGSEGEHRRAAVDTASLASAKKRNFNLSNYRSATVEERDNYRTISRSNIRRDSFGDVVCRRSPSQDSIDQTRQRRSPSQESESIVSGHVPSASSLRETLLQQQQQQQQQQLPRQLPYSSRRSPSQESYSNTPSSRRSGSQDSLDQQIGSRGRAPSQESLGTVSSRGSVSGSIYSVTSGRSEAAVSRCSSKETVRNHAPLIQPRFPAPPAAFMNGELSESAASSDDLAYAPRDYREPLGLHRTTSEPYYTFDELGIASDVAARLEHLDPRSFQHTQTIMRAGRGRLAPSRVTPYDVPETYSTAPRGRSSSATRAARSVAGAMLNKNASDNDLDHDTSILPIFQKILSERQRTRYPGARDFTMSSCPNITIKCDIVEYL